MHPVGRFTRRALLLSGAKGAAGGGVLLALAACGATPTPQVIEKVVEKEVTKVIEKEVTKLVEGTPQVVQQTVVVKETVVVQAPTKAVEPVTVELLTPDWGEKYNKIVFEDVAGWFHDQHPECTIKHVPAQSHQEKLLTQIAGGMPPDLTYINYVNAIGFAFRGVLLPLDERFAAANLAIDDFLHGVTHSLMWNGKIYGFPMCYDAMGFYWNKNVYEEVGLDPEKPPRTIAELEEHSKKILKKTATGDIERVGYAPSSFSFITFAYMRGGQFYLDNEKKVTADDPKIVEDLQWEVALMKDLDVNKVSAFWSANSEAINAGTVFPAGKMGLKYDGIWMGSTFEEAAAGTDFRYGLTYVPSVNGDIKEQEKLYQPSWGLGIPQGAKQPDWAWRFAKWYQVDNGLDVCVYTESTELYKPLVDKWIDRYVEEKLGGQIKAYGKEFLQATSMARSWWPAMPVSSMYNDEVGRAYDYAVHDQATPKQALADCTTKVQTELDRVLAALGG